MKKFTLLIFALLLCVGSAWAEVTIETGKAYAIKNNASNGYLSITKTVDGHVSLQTTVDFVYFQTGETEGTYKISTAAEGGTQVGASGWNSNPVSAGASWTIEEVDGGVRLKASTGYLAPDAGDLPKAVWCDKGADHANGVYTIEEINTYKVTYNFLYNNVSVGTCEVEVADGGTYPEAKPKSTTLKVAPGLLSYEYPEGTVSQTETKDVAVTISNNFPFQTTTITDGAFAADTKWYLMTLKGKYSYYDEANNKYPADVDSHDFSDKYQFAFTGDPENGYQIYNKLSGATKAIYDNSPADAGAAIAPNETPSGVWSIGANKNGFWMMESDGTNAYMNSRGSALSFWTNGNATTDDGSRLAFTIIDVDEMRAELVTALNPIINNIGTNPGQYTISNQDGISGAQTASTSGTAAEVYAAKQALASCYTQNKVEIGKYYRLYEKNRPGYMNVSDGKLYGSADEDNAAFVSFESATEEGQYKMNIDGQYAGECKTSTQVQMTDADNACPYTVGYSTDARLTFHDMVNNGDQTYMHNSGSKTVVGWGKGADATFWAATIITISDLVNEANALMVDAGKPGYPTAEVAAVLSKAISDNNIEGYTVSNMVALRDAINTFKTSTDVIPVTAGEYYIVNGKAAFNKTKALIAATTDGWYGGDVNPGWDAWSIEEPKEIWTLAAVEGNDGYFTLYNASTGNYIASASTVTTEIASAKGATFTSVGSGQFTITLDGSSNPLHANLHGYTSHAGIVEWGGDADSPSAWYIIPAVDTLQAYYNSFKIPIVEGATLVGPSEYSVTGVNTAINNIVAMTSANDILNDTEDLSVINNFLSLSNSYGAPLSVTYTLRGDLAEYGTIILPVNFNIPTTWTLYTCSATEGNLLTLTEAGNGGKNTPYIVMTSNTSEEKFQFVGYSNGAATKDQTPEGSLLTGVLAKEGASVVSNNQYNCYVLQNQSGKIAFYKTESTKTVPYGKCYLTLPVNSSSSSSPAFYFNTEDDLTAVEAIKAIVEDANAPIYDLQGRKVVNTVKGGIYIKNGKKFIAQ